MCRTKVAPCGIEMMCNCSPAKLAACLVAEETSEGSVKPAAEFTPPGVESKE